MKTNLLRTLTLVLTLAFAPTLFANPTLPNGDCPDIRVVVGEKKVWFIGDETPGACFTARILDAAGSVVLEKNLSSKTADWSLDVSGLPKGQYRVQIGSITVAKFRRTAEQQTLVF